MPVGPWRRAWQPTPVLLPGEPHGQRSLVGNSLWVSKSQTERKCLNMHAHVHVGTYTFAKFNSVVNVAFFFHFLTPLLNLLAPD